MNNISKLEEENEKLKLMVGNLKEWLKCIPIDWTIGEDASDKGPQMMIESLKAWLSNIPVNWLEGNEIIVPNPKCSIEPESGAHVSLRDHRELLEPIPEPDTTLLENLKEDEFKHNTSGGFMEGPGTSGGFNEGPGTSGGFNEGPGTSGGFMEGPVKLMSQELEQDIKTDLFILKVEEFDEEDGESPSPSSKSIGVPLQTELDDKWIQVSDENSRCCLLCDFRYSNLKEYHLHKRTVHGFRTNHFPCNQCGHLAYRLARLEQHIKKMHDKGLCEDDKLGRGKCMLCDFTFTLEADYRVHKKQVHGFRLKNYPCNICQFVCKRMPLLQEHIDFTHKGIKHPCGLCDFIGKSAGRLKHHIGAIHQGIRHPCECGMSFSNENNLSKHRRAVHEGVKYTCTQCDFSCSRPESLKSHKDRVHEGIMFYCDECTYKTSNKTFLRYHKEAKHEENNENHNDRRNNIFLTKVQCEHCSKMVLKSSIKSHVEVHHLGVRYLCDQCDHQATTKSNLDQHVKAKHDGIRFYCDQCSTSFSYEYSLNAHKKVHQDGFKPKEKNETYSCDQCDIRFSNSNNLVRHIKMRKNDGKKFSCGVCGDVFCFELNVTKHKRKHAIKEDMLPCDQCDKAFFTKQNLNRHKKTKHL